MDAADTRADDHPAITSDPLAMVREGRSGLRFSPGRTVLLLIAVTAAVRILFGLGLGLGMDESYMVAAGRHWQWGYFDHPPAGWWLSWAAGQIVGADPPIVVRLPFIALFALSTWLMFRLGAALFGPRAGLWAAVTLNLSPVFSVTTGSWVLPDGPLDCALLGAALCLHHGLDAEGSAAWRWWLGAGLCAAVALLSKYTACLTIAGVLLYLMTQPRHRRWLRRPEPYAAAVIVSLAVAWIVLWNATHGWASVAFQGGRAGGALIRPIMFITTFAGEAAFVLPWLWLPMMALLVQSLRRGPAKARSWFLACLGIIPVVLFPLVAVWSSKHVLFHWAAPGYLMLFPLLGRWIAERLDAGDRRIRPIVRGTVALLLLTIAVMTTDVAWNWLPQWPRRLIGATDPALDAVNWTSVRTDLAERGLLGRPGLYVAATAWNDCGKLDYALGHDLRLICLTEDPRQYGISTPPTDAIGHDVLVIVPRVRAPFVEQTLAGRFESFETLPGLSVRHAGEPMLPLAVYLGRDFRAWQ